MSKVLLITGLALMFLSGYMAMTPITNNPQFNVGECVRLLSLDVSEFEDLNDRYFSDVVNKVVTVGDYSYLTSYCTLRLTCPVFTSPSSFIKFDRQKFYERVDCPK
jgi:hypothetical protein